MAIKRLFIYIFLISLFLASNIVFVSGDATPIKLKAAVLRHFPPQYYTTGDGTPEGFAIDAIHEIARLSNADIQFVIKNSWADAFESLRSGEVDLIPNQGITERRKEWFAFTSPVETFPVRIFVRSTSKNIRSMADLSVRKTGVVRLNVGESLLSEKADITTVIYEHIKDALFDLLAGNVDAIVFPEPVLLSLARSAKIEDRITAVGAPLVEIKRAIAVRKDHSNLQKRLDNAVKQFVGSPAYERIFAKWYGKPQPLVSIRMLLSLTVLALVLIVVGMAFWRYRSIVKININLNQSIKEREQAEQALHEAYDQLEARVHERTIELADANKQLQKEIDERKQAEKEFERLARIFEESLNEIYLFRTDTLQFIHVNTAAKRNLGYSIEEFKTLTPVDLKPEFSYEAFREMIKPLLKGEQEKLVFETIHERKDTTLYNVEVHLQMLKHNHEALFAAIILDITERKKAEEALRENERNMASVLNNTHDVIVRIDRSYRHIFANPALYKATGLSPGQYLGKTNEEIGMPDALCVYWRDKHTYVFETGEPTTSEFSFHTANKGERVFQAIVTPEFGEDGTVESIISLMRDVTDIKKSESEKDALIAELEHALSEVKTLRGFIPICANCKQIRNDQGYWQQVEEYIQTHSDAQFSHGICPTCMKKLYPDFERSNKE